MTSGTFLKIAANPVEIGQEFKSYVALCTHIGIPATTGKQRQLDQRHLQCYFTWEKVAGSNRLVITETFYDAPKPFEDKRQGIHTTELGGMLQGLILKTPWQRQPMTKRKMLVKMKIMAQRDIHGLRTDAYWDYSQKQYSLLESAFTQLKKKGTLDIVQVLADKRTGEELPEAAIAVYREIFQSVLAEYKAAHIVNIYKRHLQEDFWNDVDEETQKRMGRRKLALCWKIVQIKPNFDGDVSAKEYVQAVADKLSDNYSKKNKGAIGIVSPESYQKEMQRVLEYLPLYDDSTDT